MCVCISYRNVSYRISIYIYICIMYMTLMCTINYAIILIRHIKTKPKPNIFPQIARNCNYRSAHLLRLCLMLRESWFGFAKNQLIAFILHIKYGYFIIAILYFILVTRQRQQMLIVYCIQLSFLIFFILCRNQKLSPKRSR